MKQKLTLLLIALLTTIGTRATTTYTVTLGSQVTDLNTLSADKFYVLKSNGGSGYYNYYDSENSQMSSKADYDYSCVVRLIGSETEYAIQQMSTMTYYQTLSDGSRVSLGDNLVPYTITSAGTGLFFFDNNNLKLNTNNTGNLPQGANNTWTGAFSQWKIFEVDVYKTVTLVDGTNAPYDTYGTRNTGVSPQTFTSNDASGVAGVVLSAPIIDRATWWSTYCLGIKNSAVRTNEDVTVEAPAGSLIENISMTIQAISSTNSYDVTVNGETARVTGAEAKEYTDISVNAPSFSFTINSVSSSVNWLAVKSMSLKLKPALAQIVNVTYRLYESDGTTFVSSVVVSQEVNSSVNVPTSLKNDTYFDYATEGNIGEEDCTIKVVRTPKGGIVYPITNLSNSKSYYIKTRNNARSALSTYTDNGTTYLASPVKSALGISPKKFAIISYEDSYYLYSVDDEKFVTYQNNQNAPVADVIAATGDRVTFTVATAPLFELMFDGSTSKIFNSSANYTYGVVFNGWGASSNQWDDGCLYTIEEAEDFDPTDALAALDEFFHPSYTVTYVVKDGSDNILFTSEPVSASNGENITTLPAEYQLTNFYTYNTVDVTINASGNTNVEFVATPKAEPLVKYTADTTNPYYYNLNIRSKYLVYNSDATGEVTLQDTSEPFNANASWAFIGEPYAGFKVINKTKGTDYFLTYTSVVTGGNGGSDGSNNNVQFVASADFNNRYWIIESNTGGFCMRMKENTNIYFHHQNISGSTGYLRTCSVSEWSAVHNDAGSTIVASTDEDVLVALYDNMKDYTFGSAIGQYSTTDASVVTNEQATSTIAGVGAAIAGSATSAYADCYSALNTLAANIALVTPTAGYYRFKNVATDQYLTAVKATGWASTENGVFANGDGTSAATVIKLAEKDGNLYMHNQNHSFGWVVADKSQGSGNAWANANLWDKYVNWFAGKAAGQIGFAICYGNGTGNYTSYLTRGIYTATEEDAVIGGTDYKADAAQWIVEEATSIDVAISSVGYATLCVPFAVTIPEGVDAKTGTIGSAGDERWLSLANIEGTIPAGTPVVLKLEDGYASGTYTFNIADDVDAVEGNDLRGTYFETAVGQNTYVLAKPEGYEIGFYPATTGSVAANKAYLTVANASVKAFYFFEDDATAIESIQNSKFKIQNDEVIFNLAGQRIMKAQKGINIVNGKKILK